MMTRPVLITAASSEAAAVCASFFGDDARSTTDASEGGDFAHLVVVVGDPVWLALVNRNDPTGTAQGPEWFARQLHAAGADPVAMPDYDFARGRIEVPRGRVPVTVTRIDDVPRWAGGLPETVHSRALRTVSGFADAFAKTEYSPSDVEQWFAPTRHHRRFLRRFYQVRRQETLRAKWCGRTSTGTVYLFQHVPKTAGMSVFHHCNDLLRWNDELVHLDGRADSEVRRLGLPHFSEMDSRELGRIRLVFGHDVTHHTGERLGGREIRWVTCLRDPAERLVSHFNWEMAQRDQAGQTIETPGTWLVKQRKNWITHWLHDALVGGRAASDEAAFESVSAALDRFWLVADTEHFTAAMKRLTDALDLPPISRRTNVAGETYARRWSLTAEWRDRLQNENPFDVRLLEKASASPSLV